MTSLGSVQDSTQEPKTFQIYNDLDLFQSSGLEPEANTSLPAAPDEDAIETQDIRDVASWGGEEGDKPTKDQLIQAFLTLINYHDPDSETRGKTALFFDPDDPSGPKLMEVGIEESGKEARTEDGSKGGILSFITGGVDIQDSKGLIIIGLMIAAVFLGFLIVLRQ